MGQSKKKKKHTSTQLNITYSIDEVFLMMDETSQLVAQENATRLSAMGPAVNESEILTDSVEFWAWMDRNYSKSGHFSTAENMQKYYSSGSVGEQNWTKKVVQGKGYEWDWISAQRKSFKNLFKSFNAGDVANRPGSDITELNIVTGGVKEYQLKAYTSSNKPHLKNTPKDMTVVTNAEKADQVAQLGYEEIVSFGDKESIIQARDSRLNQMEAGTATPKYSISNVSSAVVKAGMMGFVISAGAESIASYRKWKNGNLSTRDYLKEIMKSGSNAGVTATCSAGIMIPITASITTAGVSSLVTIPVSFVVSAAVDKVIAPAFARGDYLKIFKEATYYQNMFEFCSGLAYTMESAALRYVEFVDSIIAQQKDFNRLSGEYVNQQALDDFEYLASLSQEDIGVAISGMLALINDTDTKLEIIENQNCIQRMLKTVLGKNKATKDEIKKNYEKLTIYISKAIEILFERQCINQKIIQIFGNQIVSLRKDNISLNYRISVLESKMDNFTESLLMATDNVDVANAISINEIADENAKRKYVEAEKLFMAGKLIDAFDLFQMAADNNVGRAYYYLGEYYSNGYGHIKEDRLLALTSWKKGMDLGEALSTYKYGLLRYDTDDYQYRKWMNSHLNSILRLVKENDFAAIYEYGWTIICDNPGNKDNIVDSLGYFKKAAIGGYWPGAKMFYQFTEDLRRTGTTLPDYSKLIINVEDYTTRFLLGVGEMSYGIEKYDVAAKHFHQVLWLREDIVEAAAYLAFLLETGQVKDSLKEGYSKGNIPMYYSAGMKSDNPMLFYQLGTYYLNGVSKELVGKNTTKAFECFKRSYKLSKQGFTAGILGYMSLIGEGTNEDKLKAVKYLEEGCSLRDKGSMLLMSICYEQGFGVKKNLDKAKLLKQSAEQIPDLDEFVPLLAFTKEIQGKITAIKGEK